MLVLGIETSCDETAVAIVDGDRKILANEILSQIDEHTPYGGVVPEIAARAHLAHLDRLVKQALQTANVGWGDLSAIAATAGPGLIGGLLVGVTMAKAIVAARDLPFIAVNHLEAHALTARLTDDVHFPYLLLLVSGGHTQLLMTEGVGKYRRLGGTIDDAAGEAFDKVAKLLGLGFPGGPALARAAETGDAKRFAFSHPLQGRSGCDFSFSGLKTAARNLIQSLPQPLAEKDRADVAASFQAIMAAIMADRVTRALGVAPGVETLVVAGGVAANNAIRTALQRTCTDFNIALVAPPAALCTDNAAMVAWAGIERLRLGLDRQPGFRAPPALAVNRMIGIVGSGAWGTALAINFAAQGSRVALWGRDTAALRDARQNARYLPGIKFPDMLTVVQHLEALRGREIVLLAVPAQTMRDVAAMLAPHLEPDARLLICAKGIERETGMLLSRIVTEILPNNIVTVLSGPSFASEVAVGMPTAATIAGHNRRQVEALANTLSNPTLRLYHSTDIVGVELAGALKNVIAIACGIVTGAKIGENARAALMTRGLAEIARLATRLGARGETLMGLSGLGDLALTCSSLASRNFAFGHRVGQGIDAAHAGEGRLAEGIDTAEAVLTLAAQHGIEMPIAGTVHAILCGDLSIGDAIRALMDRPLRMEND